MGYAGGKCGSDMALWAAAVLALGTLYLGQCCKLQNDMPIFVIVRPNIVPAAGGSFLDFQYMFQFLLCHIKGVQPVLLSCRVSCVHCVGVGSNQVAVFGFTPVIHVSIMI